MPRVTVEERIRKRRRDATLGAALSDLEEELDELRRALGVALDDFETRLRHSIESLPYWYEPDDEESDFFGLFEVDVAKAEDVLIGPRAAALGAARVETFILEHMSPDRAELRLEFDDDDADSWRTELDDVADELDEIERVVRTAATSAERELGARLESALAALEDEREQEEEALRKKVASGEVKAGEAERKKEAELWERQRTRASSLREKWEVLEEFPFEAAELTVGTISRLRKLLENAVDALIVGYPELRDAAGDWAKPTGKRVRKFNAPPPIPKKRDPGSPSFEVDDARRETEPLDVEGTHEYERDVDVPATPETDPPRAARATPPPSTIPPATTLDEPAHRIVEGWDRVPVAEILLLLAPPLGYVLFLLGATGAYWGGLLASNPFREWHWAFPVFCGAAVYTVAMPAFLSWRIRWRGTRPTIVRHDVRRHDCYARVTADSLSVAGKEFPLPATGGSRLRFRTPDATGLAVTLEWETGESLAFAAPCSTERWSGSSSPPTDAVPDGAWEVSEEMLDTIAQRAGVG